MMNITKISLTIILGLFSLEMGAGGVEGRFSRALYKQNEKIFIYSDSEKTKQMVHKICDTFAIAYTDINTLSNCDAQAIYILAGDLAKLPHKEMPRYYIAYQTSVIERISQNFVDLVSHAVAVWDISQQNIRKYTNIIKHYSYLPNEQYEFLDPVILPCLLPLSTLNGYRKMLEYSNAKSSDISEHIPGLFCHCVLQKPSLIVEAGVRWGDGSTLPLHAATMVSNARMIGIDIDDCSRMYSSLKNASFVRMSDLDFPTYLERIGAPKNPVDFVFIDTSHEFEHSFKEIGSFISILAQQGTLGFHDSSPVGGASRGVIDAIKKYFNLQFDECRYLNVLVEVGMYKWHIVHYPFNNGMTIVKRMGMSEKNQEKQA